MGLLDIFKNKGKQDLSKAEPLKMQVTAYPIKILVAWGEAIEGNQKLRNWLIKNNYEELGMFCFALRNDRKAQKWLMKQGYPHFVALIKGIEGDKKAREWLIKNNFEVLYHMSLAADGSVDAKRFLLSYDKVYAALAKKMERVKDDIEWSNNDIHTINP
ncbi:hypothetical protein [Parvicella tangerina]|uniref:Uncharacterized protein n=1 Tax=Parvicella tangerina TaxID=2829795 RepID=A0A916JPA0_9FLAO|nr:hypothetical protein [Parvicella tangerina]CAG5082377.1 hypothetical protein CRYO30217_01896 [Parvicella tangerina]